MKKINWLDLFQKLVDPYDMNDTLSFIQKALGDLALSMSGPGVQITPDFLAPFPVTMSGSTLGGDIDGGIALDDNGQLIVVPADDNNFTITAAHATLARWDLLVLVFAPTPDTPIPKPTDPLTTVYQYLLDGFTVAVRAGTASGSPAYPTKTPGDVILAGLKVPALATLGTSVTVDLTVREQGYLPSAKFGLDPTNFTISKTLSAQTFLQVVDDLLAAGAAEVPDDGAIHDYAEVTCNTGGTAGHTVTLGASTFTLGTGAGQIPVQGTALLLAQALARAIREDATVGPAHYAVASHDGRVGITAKASGAVGTSLARSGASFTVSGSTLTGHAARSIATGATVKKQIDQLDILAGGGAQVPIGGTMEWYTETAPANYLALEGQSLLRASYTVLFGLLGTTFGTVDGTHFNLPDRRGMFSRGWDHARAKDPDAASRTAPAATGATGAGGDHVGTEQADGFKAHHHSLTTGPGGANPTSAQDARNDSSGTTGDTGGNETRPVNMNVMIIMRVL